MLFILVFIIVLIAVILPLFLNIKIKIDVHDNNISIVVAFFKIKFVNRKYSIEREKGKIFSLYQHKKDEKIFVTSLIDLVTQKRTDSEKLAQSKLLKYIIKKLHLRIHASFSIGTGDAALTANVCGSVKIVSGIAASMYGNNKRIIKINVVPIFSAKQLTADINCIIKVTPANIIIGYLIYKKTKRR